MNNNYFSRLIALPNNPNIKIANPGPNVTIKPNYFHLNPNTKQYRMGEDMITLQQAKVWYEPHQMEGKILGSTCATTVGITPTEYEKILAHVPGASTRIEVDLLEDSLLAPHHPFEVFITNSNNIEILGQIYSMKIDFNSGNFHSSNILIGVIGEKFCIELL